MKLTCSCLDYEDNMAQINALILSPWNISHGADTYNGKDIVYCPWCGKKLVEAKE